MKKRKTNSLPKTVSVASMAQLLSDLDALNRQVNQASSTVLRLRDTINMLKQRISVITPNDIEVSLKQPRRNIVGVKIGRKRNPLLLEIPESL